MNEVLIVEKGGGITIEQVSNPIEVVVNKPMLVIEPEGFVWVRNGQKEIEAYVNNVSKPDIDEFSETKKVEMSDYVENDLNLKMLNYAENVLKPDLSDYVENVSKTTIDAYVGDVKSELDDLVEQALNGANDAKSFAISAGGYAQQAGSSATSASSSLSEAIAQADRAEEYANSINPDGFVTKESFNDRSLKIGDMIISPKATRDNCIICNGAAVSRETYSDLFAAIGTLYGAGDGSTTFNIPDMRGSFPRGYKSGLTSPIGTPQAGGLPNIYGYMNLFNGANQYFGIAGSTQAQNAFFVGDYRQGWQVGTSTTLANVGNFGFDAKRANPIYGSSAEVRPINHAFNFFIKY